MGMSALAQSPEGVCAGGGVLRWSQTSPPTGTFAAGRDLGCRTISG